jgi:hypothetical protein
MPSQLSCPQPATIWPLQVHAFICLNTKITLYPACRIDGRARTGARQAKHKQQPLPSFIPSPEVNEISEPAALDMLCMYRSTNIPIPGLPDPVRTAFVGSAQSTQSDDLSNGTARGQRPALLLIHGFDSSALEWRRTFPLLAEQVDTYAIDVLGCAAHRALELWHSCHPCASTRRGVNNI